LNDVSAPLSVDWDTAVSAAVTQWSSICRALGTTDDVDLDAATRLPGWRVGELLAHMIRCAGVVAEYRAGARPPAAEIDVIGYLSRAAGAAPGVAQRAHDDAAGATFGDLRDRLAAAVERLPNDLADAEPGEIVQTRLGAICVHDVVLTRSLEGVVHGLDLVAALPSLPLQSDPAALRITVRLLLGALVARAPGRAVELRVPPIAAVQCVEGPRHTRGTPPNVVEADPVAWVEVACGRVGWSQVTADGRVRASGERSDLSALLPLL
jgi:uncharacterized protein (TIGR03083 family)